MEIIQHKHLLVRAEVNNPIKEEKVLKKWLKDLVKLIDMKIIKGPFASYVNNIGNRGITGFVMIETSHIAIHIWDEQEPALVQFDVYSCADFDAPTVKQHLHMMEPVNIAYTLFDRETELKPLFSTKAHWSGPVDY
jgi:S-adenosylmethionine/arginine decarboxylase-like enzyme|tara:strand:+ start:57 stop:464 length:408 start_codon:yes stop_codon:yes gene_type:complete